MNIPIARLLVTLLLVQSSVCFAGMRCGKNLVSEGDRFDQVKSACGEGISTYDMGSRTVYRTVYNNEEAMTVSESIKLDMWVYELGAHKFRRNLHFENGVLVKIEMGDRVVAQ